MPHSLSFATKVAALGRLCLPRYRSGITSQCSLGSSSCTTRTPCCVVHLLTSLMRYGLVRPSLAGLLHNRLFPTFGKPHFGPSSLRFLSIGWFSFKAGRAGKERKAAPKERKVLDASTHSVRYAHYVASASRGPTRSHFVLTYASHFVLGR